MNRSVKRKRAIEESSASDSLIENLETESERTSARSVSDASVEESDSREFLHSSTGATELQNEYEQSFMRALGEQCQQVFHRVPLTKSAIAQIVQSSDVPVTREQLQLLQHIPRSGERVLVQAFAGAGKTTMCRWLARRLSPLRVLYLAYNKLAAAEAKHSMPENVDARTIHSLALCYMGGMEAQREAAERFNASKRHNRIDIDALPPATPVDLQNQLAINHFALFCRDLHAASPIDFVDMAIEPLQQANQRERGNEDEDDARMQNAIIQSNRAWRRMQSGHTPYTYDAMLKQFTMDAEKSHDWISKRYDVIILDEAQDSQPILVEWLQKLKRLVFFAVGDRFQSIYSFNGTVNAMNLLQGPSLANSESNNASNAVFQNRTISTFHLTHSFRFGSNLGHFATHILRSAGLIANELSVVRGNTTHHTVVRPLCQLYQALGDKNGPIHCIARQNKTLITHALNFNARTLPFGVGGAAGLETRSASAFRRKKVHFFGNACEIVDQLREIICESPAWRRSEYNRLVGKHAEHTKNSTPQLSEWEQRRLQAFRCIADYTDESVSLLLSQVDANHENRQKIAFNGTESSDETEEDDDGVFEDNSESLFTDFDSGESSLSLNDAVQPIISVSNENTDDLTHVHYGTIHSAKGLQFDRVAILDDIICVTDACKWLSKPPGTKMPTSLRHSLGQAQFGVSERDQVREEIHLAYVALTRSKREIFINEDLYKLYQQMMR